MNRLTLCVAVTLFATAAMGAPPPPKDTPCQAAKKNLAKLATTHDCAAEASDGEGKKCEENAKDLKALTELIDACKKKPKAAAKK